MTKRPAATVCCLRRGFEPVVAALLSLSCSGDEPAPVQQATGTPDAAPPDAPVADAGGLADARPEPVRSPPPFCTTAAPGPTRGSGVALSADDSILVAIDRGYNGGVSVMDVDTSEEPVGLGLRGHIQLGQDPAQVVMDACGHRAYVLLRRARRVVEIANLHTTPEATGDVSVGSEPTSLALSPDNQTLYVANWVDGTVSVVDTSSMTLTGTWDLNPVLAGTGDLGPTVSASRWRRALAHPRSIAVSADGETVVVTEFFSQRFEAHSETADNADTNRRGYVYLIRDATGSADIEAVPLGPIADTGFTDTNNAPTGCFPNQLQSVTIDGRYAYVTAICASPEGPTGARSGQTACTIDDDCTADGSECLDGTCFSTANVKTTTQPTIHVVDLEAGAEVASGVVNLNKAFDDLYEARGTPDDETRRYPLVSNDIGFIPGTGRAFVTANGADAVFPVTFDSAAGVYESAGGAPEAPPFIDLGLYDASGSPFNSRGQNPIGIAVAHDAPVAFVANDISRNVSAIDLERQIVAGSDLGPDRAVVVDAGPAPVDLTPSDELSERNIALGRRLFTTGLGRWSLKGQAWSACQVCHFDGYSDNVTWYLARGSRQAVSLDGSFAQDVPVHRVYNWTAVFDEIDDFDGIARALSGAVGSIVHRAGGPVSYADQIDLTGNGGLDGSSRQLNETDGVLPDWALIGSWLKTLLPPRAPTGLGDVSAGEELFWKVARCHACHDGPPLWTTSKMFYTPGTEQNAALFTISYESEVERLSYPAELLPAPAGERFVRAPSPSDPAHGANDQIQCVLRDVGTYGVSPPDVNIAELRGDMVSLGQGENGFNVPSLFGANVGAPYFHAGNARTLEEAFGDLFDKHRDVFAVSGISSPGQIDQLVAYVLSIDLDTKPPPDVVPAGGTLCPEL